MYDIEPMEFFTEIWFLQYRLTYLHLHWIVTMITLFAGRRCNDLQVVSFTVLGPDRVTAEEIMLLHSVTKEYGMCRL